MAKMKVDVLIVIKYFFEQDSARTTIFTNAKHEALEELLCNWWQDECMLGSNGTTLNENDPVTIKIGYFLNDDCFSTESDAGNRGLTVGIVMDVIRRLAEIEKKPLCEMAA